MPTAEEAASAGFSLADYEPEPVDLWPENERAWLLFVEMSGQWRMSVNGPTALDYTALFLRMDRMRLDDDDWQALFADVRVLEAQALRSMREPA